MHIATVPPTALASDEAAELAVVHELARALDAPHMPAETGETLRLRMVHGWDGQGTERVLTARAASGRLLGYAELEMPVEENRNLVWFTVTVDPRARGRGVGAALLADVERACGEVGRGLLMSAAWVGSPGVPFLQRHGLRQASTAAQRRLCPHLLPREGDDDLLARARKASSEYRLERVVGPLTDEQRAEMLTTVEAINDAPLDDLELEDDNFSVARLRRYDEAQTAQQHRLYRIVARARDGSPAGHTVVAVDGLRPYHGEQHDTTVRRAHRGHRLGLRLKLDMLAWLREAEPQLRQIDTWNQESNTHMIAVNDAIGCTVVGREAELQLHLDGAERARAS